MLTYGLPQLTWLNWSFYDPHGLYMASLWRNVPIGSLKSEPRTQRSFRQVTKGFYNETPAVRVLLASEAWFSAKVAHFALLGISLVRRSLRNVEATVHFTPSCFCDVTYQLVLTMTSPEAIEPVRYPFVLLRKMQPSEGYYEACSSAPFDCVPRIRLWQPRRDDSSRVFIGAGKRENRSIARVRGAIDNTRAGASVRLY